MKYSRIAHSRVRSTSLRNLAFTLVEILVVMSIIVLLAAMAVPALKGLAGSTDINKAAWQVQGVVEQARAYAMAQNTYVWLGFHQAGSGPKEVTPPLPTLLVAAVASRDGTSNPAAANLTGLDRTLACSNLQLSGQLPAYNNSNRANLNVVQLASQQADVSFVAQSAGASYTFTGSVLEINPLGEARVASTASTALARWIEIGLLPTHGNSPDNRNTAALQIAGLTGQILMFRP